jgi:hypothetical protein
MHLLVCICLSVACPEVPMRRSTCAVLPVLCSCVWIPCSVGRWLCEFCCVCNSCGALSIRRGGDASSWGKDCKLCEPCQVLFSKDQYCTLCEKVCNVCTRNNECDLPHLLTQEHPFTHTHSPTRFTCFLSLSTGVLR